MTAERVTYVEVRIVRKKLLDATGKAGKSYSRGRWKMEEEVTCRNYT